MSAKVPKIVFQQDFTSQTGTLSSSLFTPVSGQHIVIISLVVNSFSGDGNISASTTNGPNINGNAVGKPSGATYPFLSADAESVSVSISGTPTVNYDLHITYLEL